MEKRVLTGNTWKLYVWIEDVVKAKEISAVECNL
jgi:hypothetical protein